LTKPENASVLVPQKTREMILCGLFTALIAVGAFIKIPVPVCPFTLQLLFTTLAGLLLGARLGFVAVLVYLVLGLIGVPIFTEGGGPGYILQPTFGYLIGFALGAALTGYIARSVEFPSLKRLLLANFAGLLVVYALGMIYVYFINNFYLGHALGIWPLFLYCFILAVPGDICLCILAAFVGRRLIPIVGRMA
jgi:biotin transport system substrate-specific component